MDNDRLLYIILDTIRETCNRRDNCDGCSLADDHDGRCCLNTIPGHWRMSIIRENLEKRAESEG